VRLACAQVDHHPSRRCEHALTPVVREEFVAIQHFELPAVASIGGGTGWKPSAAAARWTSCRTTSIVDPLPAGQDIVLIANVIHLFSPDLNRDLLRRVRMAMEPIASTKHVAGRHAYPWRPWRHRPLVGATSLLIAETVQVDQKVRSRDSHVQVK